MGILAGDKHAKYKEWGPVAGLCIIPDDMYRAVVRMMRKSINNNPRFFGVADYSSNWTRLARNTQESRRSKKSCIKSTNPEGLLPCMINVSSHT